VWWILTGEAKSANENSLNIGFIRTGKVTDHLDNPDNPDNPELMDNPDSLELMDNLDNPDNPDNPEHMVNPDSLELMDNLELTDNPDNPDNLDNPEHMVNPDSLELMDNLELMVNLDNLDNQANLDNQDNLVLDNLDMVARTEEAPTDLVPDILINNKADIHRLVRVPVIHNNNKAVIQAMDSHPGCKMQHIKLFKILGIKLLILQSSSLH